MDIIHIAIIAEDPLVRAGLATLLSGQPEVVIVAQLGLDRHLASELANAAVDVALLDLGWDPESSLQYLADLNQIEIPIVALVPDESHAATAWRENVHALLTREVEADQLSAALHAVAIGLIVLDQSLANHLMIPQGSQDASSVEQLTPREVEVLQLLAEGMGNKAIAHRLEISEHTVKFHVNAIMSKLGARSRTDAVVRASRRGLILL